MIETNMELPKFEEQVKFGNIRFFFDKKEYSYLCLYLPSIDAEWEDTYAYCVKDDKIKGNNGMDKLGRELIVRLLWDCFDGRLRQIQFNELTPIARDLFMIKMEEVL